MSNEQIRKIIEDSYDDSKEETLRAIGRDFYSRSFRSAAIFAWAWSIAFIALAVYSAMQFFKADQTRGQIMYAAMFSTKLDKLWAKQMHINGIADFKGDEGTHGLRKRHDLKGICPYCALTAGMVGDAGLRKPL